jgi:hypothetical protein
MRERGKKEVSLVGEILKRRLKVNLKLFSVRQIPKLICKFYRNITKYVKAKGSY